MRNRKAKLKGICKAIFKGIILSIILLLAIHQAVYAGSLESTKLVQGTEKLVNAVISWLVGIGLTVCGGYFIYYVYCLKTNDEGERRRNMQNIKTTLICMVLITCRISTY